MSHKVNWPELTESCPCGQAMAKLHIDGTRCIWLCTDVDYLLVHWLGRGGRCWYRQDQLVNAMDDAAEDMRAQAREELGGPQI